MLIPLTENIATSLACLGKPNATFENVQQCFAAFYAAIGFRRFDAPPTAAAKGHVSGLDAYTAYM